MGIQIDYYIGYQMPDRKIYPMGPYDKNGKLHAAMWRTGSGSSELYNDFYGMGAHMISDELRKEFEYVDWKGEKTVDVRYMPVTDLPNGSFIKSGYFLLEDINYYQTKEDDDPTYEDIFYDKMTPLEYAERLRNEIILGDPPKQYDCEGEELEIHSVRDYAYFAYPEYRSPEYEAMLLREAAEVYRFAIPDDAKLVILETVD